MILLDTHATLWIAGAPELLSEPARAAIAFERQRGGAAISDKTLWELAMLISRNRVGVRTSLRDFLHEVERYCIVLPVNAGIAEQAVRFSNRYPQDPADRIIGATAVIHGVRLVTADEKIRASGEVDCVW